MTPTPKPPHGALELPEAPFGRYREGRPDVIAFAPPPWSAPMGRAYILALVEEMQRLQHPHYKYHISHGKVIEVDWLYTADQMLEFRNEKISVLSSAAIQQAAGAVPAVRQPLTDEQILDEASHHGFIGSRLQLIKFTRAIEAAHNIK